MRRPLIPLQMAKGLIAAIVAALGGFLVAYALLLAPNGPWWFWDSNGGGLALDIDRSLAPALFVAATAGWGAFATFAPPGKHRLISALGIVFFLSAPMTVLAMSVVGEHRPKGVRSAPPAPASWRHWSCPPPSSESDWSHSVPGSRCNGTPGDGNRSEAVPP